MNSPRSGNGKAIAVAASGVPVLRTGITLNPESSRVLVKPFDVGSPERCRRIIERVLRMEEQDVDATMEEVLGEFEDRHLDLEGLLSDRFRQMREFLPDDHEPSHHRRLLIGAHFTSEYALESAALFNPSMVPHPDQSGISKGSLRFVMSLRATGEGHISSIEFRSGIIDSGGNVNISPAASCVTAPRRVKNPMYARQRFRMKLNEIGLHDDFTQNVIEHLEKEFSLEELDHEIDEQLLRTHVWGHEEKEIATHIRWLARSNYEVHFSPETPLSQRIIHPDSPTEKQGIEDARFVLFEEADGSRMYYATYTAWDGQVTLPQLLETPDFVNFKLCTLNGSGVSNKGMALFPRKVNGHYAMLSRQDDECIFLMYSEDIHFWRETKLIARPENYWECMKIGNCGPPIETSDGWLVITHGVGPMRKYCIGALLLDLEDPTKIIGRLKEPLVSPDANEREGYVPNVVYSCGSLLHNGTLILPYAMSDYASTVATVRLDELLSALRSN